MAHPVIIKAARQRVIPTYLLLLADYPADQVLHEELRKTLVHFSGFVIFLLALCVIFMILVSLENVKKCVLDGCKITS